MLEVERDAAIRLAYEAGRIALAAASRSLKVEKKGADLGPVTAVDLEVDVFLRTELARAFPEDSVVSEEGPPPAAAALSRVWFVDPIDGTEELIRGSGEWSILIGLTQARRAVLGVVYRPVTGELYHAISGEGAFRRTHPGGPDVPIHVSEIRNPKDAVLLLSRSHPNPKVERVARVLGIRESFPMGSIGVKLATIAAGEADLYLNFSGKCHVWDLCAPEVVLREAGGAVRSLRGEPILYGVDGTAFRRPFAAAANGLIALVAQASAGIEVDPT
ncbi:MAG TPA: 3'(2'),5'-bisphosphate nucleotidase CysQ [Vicinamibacteria bacterium]